MNTFVRTNILRFIDLPGKPDTPEIVDWDVDRVDLKWKEPKSDGGAPITGYIIEKKEKFSPAWSEILTTRVSIYLKFSYGVPMSSVFKKTRYTLQIKTRNSNIKCFFN